MKKILQNRIKCNFCGDIIESVTVNDYVECSCGRVAVDGGLMYLRRIFLKETDFTELSELEKENE